MMNLYAEKKKKCEKENSSFPFLKANNVFLYEWAKCIFYFTAYYISSDSGDDLMKFQSSVTSA